MTRQVVAAKIGSPLSEFSGFFSSYTGLPVVDEELKVVGVISKKDISNPPNGVMFFENGVRTDKF